MDSASSAAVLGDSSSLQGSGISKLLGRWSDVTLDGVPEGVDVAGNIADIAAGAS